MKWPWIARDWDVLGLPWRVKLYPLGDETVGDADPEQQKIRLDPTQSDARAVQTWIHEMAHAIEDAIGVKFDHDLLEAVSRAIFCIWAHNPKAVLRLAYWMAECRRGKAK